MSNKRSTLFNAAVTAVSRILLFAAIIAVNTENLLAKGNCYYFFSNNLDALKDVPSIFAIKNGYDRLIRLPESKYRKDEMSSRAMLRIGDLAGIGEPTEIHHEFQIMGSFFRPKISYKIISNDQTEVTSTRSFDVLIVRQGDERIRGSSFDTRNWVSRHTSLVSGCRVTREIVDYTVLRTLVEVNPGRAAYGGQACIRTGILMAQGLNNIDDLMGSQLHMMRDGEYSFIFTGPNGLSHISVPEMHPGMSIEEFDAIGRKLSCADLPQ